MPLVAKMVNGAREAALGTALRDGSDPTSTLEEYAWRSLIARVRVRDYCEGATFAVCAVSNLEDDAMLQATACRNPLCRVWSSALWHVILSIDMHMC